MTNLFSLDNKKILVTGTTRGLGFLLAKGLAQHGAEIIVNGTSRRPRKRRRKPCGRKVLSPMPLRLMSPAVRR